MGESPRKLLNGVALDDVADLEVVEVQNTDSTLEALTDFLDVILEALERGNRTVIDHDSLANNPTVSLPVNATVRDIRTRDRPDLADLEHFADLSATLDGLTLLW